MERAALLDNLAKVIQGLQAPLSLSVPLGTARDPLVEILGAVETFGWVDEAQVRAFLEEVL